MNDWFKIKNGQMNKIKAPANREIYLKKGYTLTHSYMVGNVNKIESFSPMTRDQAWEQHKKRGVGLF